MYAKALRWGLTAPGERTENEGPVGTRSGDADCQVGSVCRIWWGLVRKDPMAGVNPEAVGVWQLCVQGWWIAVMSK